MTERICAAAAAAAAAADSSAVFQLDENRHPNSSANLQSVHRGGFIIFQSCLDASAHCIPHLSLALFVWADRDSAHSLTHSLSFQSAYAAAAAAMLQIVFPLARLGR